MIRLVLMRHGEAESFASNDAARQLTQLGRAGVRKATRRLIEVCPSIDKMIVSPYERAMQTAGIVASAYETLPQIVSDQVTPDRSPFDVLEVIEEYLVGVDTGLIVFHQPIVSRLIHFLTGEQVSMPTAGVAVIDAAIPGRGTCELECVI